MFRRPGKMIQGGSIVEEGGEIEGDGEGPAVEGGPN